jgi:hypothetical protein
MEHVALCLTGILPLKCKVIATAQRHELNIVNILPTELIRRWAAWSKVGNILSAYAVDCRDAGKVANPVFTPGEGPRVGGVQIILSDDQE